MPLAGDCRLFGSSIYFPKTLYKKKVYTKGMQDCDRPKLGSLFIFILNYSLSQDIFLTWGIKVDSLDIISQYRVFSSIAYFYYLLLFGLKLRVLRFASLHENESH